MKDLWRIFLLILRDQKKPLIQGAALGLIVLLAGVALLGLSGWFITAAAIAGMLGTGAVFDVFRPSAMVRLLALGRTAARYGERLSTHDATLRALSSLRVRVLEATASLKYEKLLTLRGAQALNRLTADIDALDGVPLRLVLPIAAGLLAQAVSFVAIWILVDIRVALVIATVFVAGTSAIVFLAARAAMLPSRKAEMAAQSFRAQLIDLLGARADLAVYGQLRAQGRKVSAADQSRQADLIGLDRIERRAGLALSLSGTVAAGGALGLGMTLARNGDITPPLAALGFFAALALMETVVPMRRMAAELGRMAFAAARVNSGLEPDGSPAPHANKAHGATITQVRTAPSGPAQLCVDGLSFHRGTAPRPVLEAVCFEIRPGESLAVTGPSGVGKSTLLLLLSGLLQPSSGRILIGGVALTNLDEPELRNLVTLVPQRSALMAGTVAEALRLAAPTASDARLWAALSAVALERVIEQKGGLDFRLGSGGGGLSGGEARRLALARGLLRHPRVLLLDEPTEGLDEVTAKRVLSGLRDFLPTAIIVMASHRRVEIDWAGRRLDLTSCDRRSHP